jgi:quinol monooxygenase YgiN
MGQDLGAPTPLIVLMRFVVPDVGADDFAIAARAAADLLSEQAGCTSVQLGRATDDVTRWTLTSHWESVGSYRRALSSFEVKLAAVPLLSQAIDEPTAYEVLYQRAAGDVVVGTSARAEPEADNRGQQSSP